MRAASAMVLGLALSGCLAAPGRTERRAYEEGYAAGAADAVKRLYWARQALEKPGSRGPAGRVEYYSWEESGTARDGRRLAPESIGVPVFVPSPVPAGGPGP